MVCFSPDGEMVEAGPLETPSMELSFLMASRWAAMTFIGSERSCPRGAACFSTACGIAGSPAPQIRLQAITTLGIIKASLPIMGSIFAHLHSLSR
jgi:hypothetical protein